MNQNRYEKEIEDILRRAGERSPEQPGQEPEEPPRRRRRSASPRRGIALRGAGLNYKTALLAGIVLLVVAMIIETGELYLFLAGVALLGGGYVMYYRAPRSGSGGGGGDIGSGPKMWRGRPIDPDDDPHFTDDRWGRRR